MIVNTTKDLINKTFYGQVVDNNDPDKEGRCKVRVFGVFTDILDEDLPWAMPGSLKIFGGGEDGGAGEVSIPKLNAIVRIQFPEGNLYSPEWIGLAYINQAVRDEINNSYLNSHVIAYDVDEQVKILYTPDKGILIFHKNSQIIINPDSSITIEHSGGQSIIELIGGNINIVSQTQINVISPKCVIDSGNVEIGEGASEKLVLGDSFKELFNNHTHIGNLGAPTSPPFPPMPMNDILHLSKIAKTL